MGRSKVTITVDREKLVSVQAITGAASASQAIDLALSQVIRAAQLRRDVEAYSDKPPTAEEISLASSRGGWGGLADDTDWEALYADGGS
jgi:hypothetical protein